MAVEYATTLRVQDAGSGAAAGLADVAQLVAEWAQIENVKLDGDGELVVTLNEGHRVTTQLVDPGDPDMWAWSLTNEVSNDDRSGASVDWRATVTVLEATETTVYCSVERSVRDERLRRLATRPKPPRIVGEILRCSQFRVLDGLSQLSGEARSLDVADVDSFVTETLLDAGRNLPVVAISERGPDGRPDLDPVGLARDLVGVAHVWVIPKKTTWALSDRMGARLSVYNGAVRIWWPGFSLADNPFDHELWLPRVGAGKIADEVVDLLYEVASRQFRQPSQATELESRIRRQQDDELRRELDVLMDLATRPAESGEDETRELGRSVRDRIALLESDRDQALEELVSSDQAKEDLARELSRLKSENYQLRSRAGYWEEAEVEGHPTTPESAFVDELTSEYESRFTADDRLRYPLASVIIGKKFLATLDQADVPRSKVLQVCAEVASRRAREVGGRQVHPLRSSDGPNAPQRIRQSDGGEAWRCYIAHNTPQAGRLHWWTVGEEIEFASVGPHDDMDIPE